MQTRSPGGRFILTHALCGARTRKGTPCQRRAYGNGRCRNHGGLSTGPKTPEGRERIADAQKRRWAHWRAGQISTAASLIAVGP